MNDILANRGFAMDLDYLRIDLDGMDFWIWESLEVQPRLVVCEYNPMFGPKEAVTVPYDPSFSRRARDERGEFIHPRSYYGASLRSLKRLGRRKGYDLVCAVPGTQNAYFVRSDVNPGIPSKTSRQAFLLPTKGKSAAPYRRERYRRIQREGVLKYFAARGGPLLMIDD